MRKWILILGLLTSFHVKADVIAQGDDCGEDCHWELSDDGALTITGSGNMYDYDNLPSTYSHPTPWGQNITSVSVSGLSSIGAYAFSYSDNLTSVSLSDSVTRISGAAFEKSKNVENIILPKDLTYIGGWAFFGLNNLNEITIPENVSYIGKSAFADTGITTLVLPETLFTEDAEGLSPKFLHHSKVTTIYCPETSVKCKEMNFQYQGQWDHLTQSYPNVTVNVSTYKKENGKYVLGNTRYSSFEDMQQRKNGVLLKRIYSVEEAEKVSKKTGNTFRIRYK